MHIKTDIKLDFDDVLLCPKISGLVSRKSVNITRDLIMIHSGHTHSGIPIIASNMDGVGTFSMAMELQKHNMYTAIRKHYTPDEWDTAVDNDLDLTRVAVCTGSNAIHDPDAQDYATLKTILERHPIIEMICIDVANGYQRNFLRFVRRVRKEFPDKTIMAGNVVTPEITGELIHAGADIIKVGIGPGSACTTRIVTGVGYPQLSAIMECAEAAHGINGMVVADGGCRTSGDVVKAFAAGADFVMLGGMLAGHRESEEQVTNENGLPLTELPSGNFTDGNVVLSEEECSVRFYGMSSDDAMEKHGTRKDGYRSSEGKVVSLPFRGPAEKTILEVLGGVRSACTYLGAVKLKEISKRATFVRVNTTHNRVFDQYNV